MPSDIKGKTNPQNIKYRFIHCAKHDKGQRSYARNDSGSQRRRRSAWRDGTEAVQSTAPESSSPRTDMLFSDYLQFWLQWKRSTWEEVTYSGYAANVNTWIAPYFSQRGTKLNEINVLDIEMFYAHEKNTRNISGNTVAHYHANIHKALVDAVRLS